MKKTFLLYKNSSPTNSQKNSNQIFKVLIMRSKVIQERYESILEKGKIEGNLQTAEKMLKNEEQEEKPEQLQKNYRPYNYNTKQLLKIIIQRKEKQNDNYNELVIDMKHITPNPIN